MPEEPLTTKQHAVPQQVFGVQFKLVGDLTVRQFAILAICGFFAFAFFSSGLFILFRIIISATFLLGGVAFAFVPVQDQPLDQWISAFFRAVYTPTRRMWAKSSEPAEFLVLEVPKIARTTEPGLSAEESRRRLQTYLGGIHERQELSPLDLAEEQYLNSIRTMAQGLVAVTAPVAPAPIPTYTPSPALTLEEVIAAPTAPAPAAYEPPAPRFVEAQHIAERPSLASDVNFTEPVYKVQRGRVSSYFAARRNVRAGRRLTPLAIAGTMVYAPVGENILAPELPETPTLPTIEPIAPPILIPEVEPIPPAPPPPPPVPESPPIPTPPPPPVPEAVPSEVEAPPPMPAPEPTPPVAPLPSYPTAPPLPEPSATKTIAPPKAGENVIAGTLFDPPGGVLPQTLIIIEDEKGNVVRAIKSSELGRFKTSPLPNGNYSIKVPKTGFPFATMKIELTGKVMDEMELRPKG